MPFRRSDAVHVRDAHRCAMPPSGSVGQSTSGRVATPASIAALCMWMRGRMRLK
jgi:hypothetical protein